MIVKVIGSCILVFVVGFTTWSILTWANSPVKRQIVVSSGSTNASLATQDIATDYFTTKIPASYTVQTDSSPGNESLVQLVAFSKDGKGAQVGITSAPVPASGLDGVADYLFRIRRTDSYEEAKTIGFASGSTFRKKDGTEVTTFIVQNGRYASISVSGESIDSEQATTLRTVLAAGWRWL